MSKFRVGDVCVVVYVTKPENHFMVGQECTVIAVGKKLRLRETGEIRFDGVKTTLNEPKHSFSPDQIRLRRPPSWDRFIYDTSAVDSEEKVPA